MIQVGGRIMPTMVENTYGARLAQAMAAAQITAKALADRLGISYQAVRKAMDGRSKSLSAENNSRAAAVLGVSPDWLATGLGSREPSESTRPPSDADWNGRPESLVRLRRHLVPVVGKAKLGDDGYFAELEYPVGHGDGYVDCPTDDPNAYALHCVGSSMLPRIKPGEYVVMEPGRQVVPGDEVLVRSSDGRVMVKELLYIRDDHAHLGSVNDNQPKIAIPVQEIDRMHYVAAIVKRARWTPDYEPDRRVANVEPNPQRRIGEANWNFPGTTETENTPKADSLRAPERGA